MLESPSHKIPSASTRVMGEEEREAGQSLKQVLESVWKDLALSQ